MITTNTRLNELRQTAERCQSMVDLNLASAMVQDYVDLYQILKDHCTLRRDSPMYHLNMNSQLGGPHIENLLSQ